MPVLHWLPDAPLPCLTEASLRRPRPDQISGRCHVIHGLPQIGCSGNGAAELFTWAARDAAAVGVSGLLAPGFATLAGPSVLARGIPETPLALIGITLPVAHPALEVRAWI